MTVGLILILHRSVRLLSKLYKHKLEVMLKELNTTVCQCTQCQGLFSLAAVRRVPCPASWHKVPGKLSGFVAHEPDPSWKLYAETS